MKADFQGQLEGDVLVNLLQYLALNSASGLLQLRDGGSEAARIYLEQGRVIHLELGPLRGPEGLATLLSWDEGHFLFRAGVSSPEQSIKLSLDSLLLKAVHEADESARQGKSKLGAESILTAKATTQGQNTISLTLKSLHLLRQLDGKRSLGHIAQELNAPLPDVLQAAEELHEQQLVNSSFNASVDPDFVNELMQLTRDIMGPVGGIVVEDILDDLGLTQSALPEASVPQLVDLLGEQFQRADWQKTFAFRVRRLCERYELPIS